MLKLYNTKTRSVEVFVPIHQKKVNMYVCGPTVYDHIHIGNARPVIFFSFLKNYLTYLGYDVFYVSNITDIDDKIIDKAILEQKTEKEISEHFTEAFLQVSQTLNHGLPDQMPKATDYMPQMITYIENLIDKGYAYKRQDAIYFEVDKVKDYGKFSNQNTNELIANVRIINDVDKINPRDFTLWKRTDKGISFDSPWFSGRPGWHTECAVMNREIFGGEIDIHGGGTDLIFPHHENEIAQTIAHDGHGLSKYWMHVGRLDLGNEKMSKSLGNVILAKTLLSRVDHESFKLLILGHHYRAPIQYREDLLSQYMKMYDKIKKTILKYALLFKVNQIKFNTLNVDKNSIEIFEAHMNDDLNTPNVVTLIQDLIKKINGSLNDLEIAMMYYQTLKSILDVFGIFPSVDVRDETVLDYQNWQIARDQKNYEKADYFRTKLLSEGWI